ncbi:hypothetical protein AOQ84DRAFT_442469 [Glonium stellatum]|uniref:Nephrocystin 3-like N-terminal domain-containing protein n=1 Tax=Glonium stellatum TaxID=574774 RepID=A0A8E2ES40_9PEZI|nr:hypothetical protein AOQ84DRAFT_442469 [Glonium stellatum]
MDPLTIFSLGCGIMQVISFSHETLSIIKCDPKTLNKDELDLLDAASGLVRVIEELETLLSKVAPRSGSKSSLTAARKTMQYWRYESEIDRLEKAMNGFQSVMDSGLLSRLCGKAGSGKSTLMKFLVDHPKTSTALTKWRQNVTILEFFLWNSGSQMQRSIKGLLCSLLYRLLDTQRTLLQQLLSEEPLLQAKEKHFDWSVIDLRRLIIRTLSIQPSPVCIFLDGLDEISNPDRPSDLLKLIEGFDDAPSTKICVSSRPEPAFHLWLGDRPQLKLQALTAKDIRTFVQGSLKNFKGMPETLKNDQKVGQTLEELVILIVEKADGVFLWVWLVLISLETGL